MSITEPGIYTMSEAEYHADPCEPFSLSRGIAHLLLTTNPRKAAWAHPKIGGGQATKPNRAMDAGSIVHGLMLGVGAELTVMETIYPPKHKKAGQPVRDYKTAAAEAEAEAIREAGGIPVLVHEESNLRACADAALRQLRGHPDGADFFAPGRSEAVVIWQEGGIWLRAMIDRLPDHPQASPYDLKLTNQLAAPGAWDRRLQTIYAFQDAFYRRGLKAVRGVKPGPILFPVTELAEPYCQAIHAAAPSLQDLAEREVERAIRTWAECVRTDQWPSYPPHTAWVEASVWQINQADERDLRDEFIQEQAA